MNYEIHVTAKVKDTTKFILDCKSIGVKPILIETQNKYNTELQVMTSSKYIGDDYTENLNRIVDSLQLEGYELLRKKVEIKPEPIKHKGFIYYESHFRLKLEQDRDLSDIKNLCDIFNLHLSKNLLKKGIVNLQMITFRNYDITFQEFNTTIELLKEELDFIKVEYDKIEIEECILDTNVLIDKKWLQDI